MICASLARSSRVLRDLHIISHSVLFVKGFFKSFFNFFQGSFDPFPSPFGGSARLLYHISFHLSRGFSKVFSTFFVISFGVLSFWKATRLLYHISFRLSRGFPKVFSTFFVTFFRGCSHLATACFASPAGASRLVLAYYSTSFPFCQPFFSTFFHFGIAGTLS